MGPYAASGTFTSRVFDVGGLAILGIASWSSETPTGTSLVISVRTGDTPTPDGTWTPFIPKTNGASLGSHARYLQYRAELSTSDLALTPTLKDVTFNYSVSPPTAVTLYSFTATASNRAILILWDTIQEIDLVGFHLYRSTSLDGEKVRQNTDIIPAKAFGSLYGASYEFLDLSVQPGETYYYWLEPVQVDRLASFEGPVSATALRWLYLPLVSGPSR